MKRYFSLMILVCALLPVMAHAQAPQIADTVTVKDTRTAINDALNTLYNSALARPPYYSVLFTAQTAVTVSGGTHGFTTAPCALAVMVYDNSNPRQLLAPDGTPPLTVNPTTCDVTVRFASATTFYVSINGGIGQKGDAGAQGIQGPAGTNANVAVTGNALKGDGAGGAVPVTGTATDCVRVNGTSGTCGAGGTTYTAGKGIYIDGANAIHSRIDPTVFRFEDNFLGASTVAAGGGMNVTGWAFVGTGSTLAARQSASTAAPSTRGHAGIWVHSTNTLGNVSYMFLAGSSGNSLFTGLGVGGDFTGWATGFTLLFNPTVNSGAPANLAASSLGTWCYTLGNSNAAMPTGNSDTFGVCVATGPVTCTVGSVVDGHWFLMSNNQGTKKCADTGVMGQSSVWTSIDLVSSTLGTAALSVNGSTPVSVDNVGNWASYPLSVIYPANGLATTIWYDHYYFIGFNAYGRAAIQW